MGNPASAPFEFAREGVRPAGAADPGRDSALASTGAGESEQARPRSRRWGRGLNTEPRMAEKLKVRFTARMTMDIPIGPKAKPGDAKQTVHTILKQRLPEAEEIRVETIDAAEGSR